MQVFMFVRVAVSVAVHVSLRSGVHAALYEDNFCGSKLIPERQNWCQVLLHRLSQNIVHSSEG
jgi:hypothetical protein